MRRPAPIALLALLALFLVERRRRKAAERRLSLYMTIAAQQEAERRGKGVPVWKPRA